MQFPDAQRIDFYGKVRILSTPFESWVWKAPGARTTPHDRADFYRRLFQVNRDLATAGLDLGQSLQEIRVRMTDAARALHHSVLARPTYCEPVDALEAFCGLSVARDPSAMSAFASLYADTAEGSSGGDSTKTRVPMYWGLVNVLVAHGSGASLTAAATRLQKLRLPTDEDPKVMAIREAFREFAVHCATANSPDPTELLQKVAEANGQFWKFDDVGNFEAYLSHRALALACIARDRGWKVPEADPHPSMPLGLLRMKPTKVDLTHADFSRPANETKVAVAAAKKQVLALKYPRKK